MRLKSYFAGTVESAMRLARQEMGDEALLVNSRKAPPEARHLGEYEVVFAVTPAVAPPLRPTVEREGEAGKDAAIAAARPVNRPANPAALDLANEVADIRRQLERMAAAVARSNSLHSGRQFAIPELAEAFALLTAAEVNPDLAISLTESLAARLVSDPFASRSCDEAGCEDQAESSTSTGSRRIRHALSKELRSRIKVAPELGSAGGKSPRVVALVGPPGSGKTTTLIKLAASHGMTSRRPTHLISMDCYRIAAAEQLRSYAAILGAGFSACDTVAGLAQTLDECKYKDLVLIDTPGHGPSDISLSEDLARYLASRPDIETHLVLSCSTKSADLSRVVNRLERFRPARMLFTRLDETSTYGVILNEALRADLPISYLANGQQIPEDLEAATSQGIVDLILNGRRSEARITDRVTVAAMSAH